MQNLTVSEDNDHLGTSVRPDPHVDEKNGIKIIVYNTKKNSKKEGQEKRLEKRKREREQKVEEIQQ